MKLRQFLIVNAVLFVPFGTLMVIIPGLLFPVFGIDLEPDGILMARVFGSALMNFGIMCYLVRNEATTSTGLKAILIGNLVFHALDSISTFIAAYSGVMNALGWMFFALHLILTLGFAYYLFGPSHVIISKQESK